MAKAHVLALQQCREGELVPDGQQVELARSFVAFTRAKGHLWIWVQALELAAGEWTAKLQQAVGGTCHMTCMVCGLAAAAPSPSGRSSGTRLARRRQRHMCSTWRTLVFADFVQGSFT